MVKTRPFWSDDLPKTEKWLNKMGRKGFVLKKINFTVGIFEFERAEASDKKYRIVYDKGFKGNMREIPEGLLTGGYNVVFCAKKYYVLSFSGEPEIKPSYSMFFEKNQKKAFIIGTISLCATIILSILIFIPVISAIIIEILTTSPDSTIIVDSATNTNNVVTEVLGLVIPLIIVCAYIWCVATWFKLRESNKVLAKLCGEKITYKFTAPENIIMPKDEIKRLKKQKLLVKKTKIGWIYAPDKIEKWLEKMESKGFNLYRLSKMGNSFYFIKGKPRKMKYVVDNQKCAMPEYFKINTEAGWKLIFRSLTRSWAYIVWSHEVGEEEVVFMCNEEENLKRAKRLFVYFSICYIPVIVLYIGLISMNIFFSYSRGLEFFDYYMIVLFLLIIFEFGYFTIASAGYYLRSRKIFKETGSIRL